MNRLEKSRAGMLGLEKPRKTSRFTALDSMKKMSDEKGQAKPPHFDESSERSVRREKILDWFEMKAMFLKKKHSTDDIKSQNGKEYDEKKYNPGHGMGIDFKSDCL